MTDVSPFVDQPVALPAGLGRILSCEFGREDGCGGYLYDVSVRITEPAHSVHSLPLDTITSLPGLSEDALVSIIANARTPKERLLERTWLVAEKRWQD